MLLLKGRLGYGRKSAIRRSGQSVLRPPAALAHHAGDGESGGAHQGSEGHEEYQCIRAEHRLTVRISPVDAKRYGESTAAPAAVVLGTSGAEAVNFDQSDPERAWDRAADSQPAMSASSPKLNAASAVAVSAARS